MKETMCDVMYKMFLDGVLPDLDMDDYETMWVALLDLWDIDISDENWRQFIEEINCKKSNDYQWFKQTFNKYFYG